MVETSMSLMLPLKITPSTTSSGLELPLPMERWPRTWMEGVLPAVPLLPPGAKLGLSNIVTVLCGGLFGAPAAFAITALKALFALVTRGVTAGLMSLAGGLLSTIVLWALLKSVGKTVSYLGVGVLWVGVYHNMAKAAFYEELKSLQNPAEDDGKVLIGEVQE